MLQKWPYGRLTAQLRSWFALVYCFFFFSSRRRHTRFDCDWSSDVCSSDLESRKAELLLHLPALAFRTIRLVAGAEDQRLRSEERRVGKECRSRWSADR